MQGKKDIKLLLIKRMTPILWNNNTIAEIGTNSQIQQTLLNQAEIAVKQAAPIAKFFKGANDRQSLLKIHTFIRQNLGYRRDPKGLQQIKLPNRFIIESGDCKSNALFVYAIAKNLGIPIDFRFTNYKKIQGQIPSHVYNIAYDRQNKKYIFIDGTSKFFGIEKKKPNFVKNGGLMKIQTLSDNMQGIEGKGKLKAKVKKATAKVQQAKTKVKTAIKKAAAKVKEAKPLRKATLAAPRTAFLAVTRLNFRGIATKLKNKLTDKGLQDKWKSLGGDTKALNAAVNAGANKKPLLGIREEIGSLAVAGTTATAAAPIIASLSKWIGKIETTAAKVKAAQNTPAAKKVGSFLAKNKTLVKKLDTLKGEAKKRVINEVAQRTGQSPADIENIFQEGKQSVEPGTNEPGEVQPETTGNNKKALLIGGAAIAAVAIVALSNKKKKKK